MTKLEVCCYSVDCAITAAQSGADRIELCAGQREGGLTPSYGALRGAREKVTIPVHPIVRPRGGDFCYSPTEFAAIKYDIEQIREMGFPGVVVGVLNEEGHIDLPKMREIMAVAQGMAVTFHRAFDMCLNPYVALEQLTDLGVSRILSSGQQQTAENGLRLLRELTQASRGPIIMAGSGVRLTNVHKFQQAGIRELHSSAGQWTPSSMRYRKIGVSMCSDAELDEFSQYCVDGDVVEAMKLAVSPDREMQYVS
ncbi:copper homeostasis protein CutC [Pectobacterium zantedeschiae]|uniref:PF03932 family protein CutC n=1 Tax=Pectobacterium zantedeschiae TaxID=2034769 RepID=A0A9X8JLJ3_9GAMM|nr:copper homeostasis protein CutC [Pectobacterium zantedeschiae]RYC44674.1 copper homeostasis protein CutC [Pectobacterium zantedeschiae]RYC48315.1 copper homeostasis protein CutC [Pectobacterium zantedeschiae]RYC49829.1 copper homeostasis protein CutC [Pectobacterium zantedeschiae]